MSNQTMILAVHFVMISHIKTCLQILASCF